MLAEPAPVLPLRPWLTTRWVVRLGTTSVAAASVAAVQDARPVLAMAIVLFCAGGLAGYRRATRWFHGPADAVPARLRLTGSRRPDALLALLPTVALAVFLGLTAASGGGPGIAVPLAAVWAARAGTDLGAAAVVAGWERRTGYRVVRLARHRPVLRRLRLRAYAADPPDPAHRPRLTRGLPWLLAAGALLGCTQLAVLTAQGAFWRPPPTRTSHTDPALSAVAGRLAGRTTVVTCWSTADWKAYERRTNTRIAGLTWLGRIYLAPAPCGWLEWERRTGEWPALSGQRYELAVAGGVLAHEAGHVRLGSNETTAECFAYDHVAEALTLVGVSRSHALELQAVYRREAHPQLPPQYRRHPCV